MNILDCSKYAPVNKGVLEMSSADVVDVLLQSQWNTNAKGACNTGGQYLTILEMVQDSVIVTVEC